MAKQLIKNYSYNTTSKTVTLTDFTTVSLDRLQLITDVTTNTIIYNFADSTVATATVSGNVITLSAAPGSNTDKLMIIYDAMSGDPVYDGYKELASLSAGSLNADLVPSTDVSGYRWFSVHLSGTWVGSLTFQGSNDGTNFASINVFNSANTAGVPTQVVGNTTGANVIYQGPITTRYVRVRMTTWTSGSAGATAEFYTQPTALANSIVSASQVGTWTVGSNSATGSAVPANAFYMAGNNAADSTLKGVTVAPYNVGDAVSASAVGAFVISPIFNGTNMDRLRSATSAAGTTGTGVPAAGMLGFDGTNYQRVKVTTTGQYNPGPQTSGGVTVAKIASAATTNATSVKATAGQVYGWSLFNTSATVQYLKFYNLATAPTVGTSVPVFIVPLPAGGGSNIMLGDLGTPLATGIAYSISTGVADTDATATTANAVVGSVYYA